MKQGFKRSFVVLMLCAAPLVYAQPVSLSQDIAPRDAIVIPGLSVSIGDLPVPSAERPFYGTASWYSRSDRGIKKRTASGALFDHFRMACASWAFPLGTRVRVTNLQNGRSVICVVNDRGPAKRLNRLVDLTKAAFREISDLKHGLVRVSVVPLYDCLEGGSSSEVTFKRDLL